MLDGAKSGEIRDRDDLGAVTSKLAVEKLQDVSDVHRHP
jgi:hypothetical protein